MARSPELQAQLRTLDRRTARLRLHWVDRAVARAPYEGGPVAGIATEEGFPGLDRAGGRTDTDPAELVLIPRLADDVAVGVCPVSPVEGGVRHLEVSVGIAKPAQKCGYGTEGLKAVVNWLLKSTSALCVGAVALPDTPGERLLRRARFHRCGGRVGYFAICRPARIAEGRRICQDDLGAVDAGEGQAERGGGIAG